MRNAPDSVAARIAQRVNEWSATPWACDYFAVMRRLEALAAPAPRWGHALLPSAEAIRVRQEPSLAFATASISRFDAASAHEPPGFRQQFFGYLGPNGPLPVHLSEFIRERALNFGDRTALAFLDVFTHRFALHFYRAWAQARPVVALDRPGEDSFRRRVGALVGIGGAARQGRDAVHDDARLHFAGWLVRRVHSAEGVEAVLRTYFAVPVRLERWVGHWMRVPPDELTCLGRGGVPDDASCRLGQGALMGRRVWDRQHKVRLHIGPLSLAQYRGFLPTGAARPVLLHWMQELLGDELEWDTELALDKDDVPAIRLGCDRGNAAQLGWVSWLGGRPRTRDATDVRIDARASDRTESDSSKATEQTAADLESIHE